MPGMNAMNDNVLLNKAMDFGVKVLKACDGLTHHSSLMRLIEDSSLTIGARMRQSAYAKNKTEFIAEFEAALKACYESQYWIEMAKRAGLIPEDVAEDMIRDNLAVALMLQNTISAIKKQPDPVNAARTASM